MKLRLTVLILVFAVLFSLSACSTAQIVHNAFERADDMAVREYTDSCGRTVTIPEAISKVAVSGPLSQIYVYPLCADLLVGFSSDISSEAEKYIPDEYFSMPKIGQLYGGERNT